MEKNNDLFIENDRISIILSQIQPHFLYNALTLIQQYCRTDPKTAEATLIEFSNYLRGSLDSLVLKKKITFERELCHVKNYLSIEKKRFEDKINVEYDIKAENFMLPPLALQAIVENAVRHGVTKKEGKGTVRIETCEKDGNIVITVTDDGVGFIQSKDKNLLYQQPGGIKNVCNRLSVMCGGFLEVTSEPNIGTKAEITIPGVKNEYNCG
ncbi:MAG: histidine kinase [Treponema sp.]|nr:histidine kinase [Treponema sp.]